MTRWERCWRAGVDKRLLMKTHGRRRIPTRAPLRWSASMKRSPR